MPKPRKLLTKADVESAINSGASHKKLKQQIDGHKAIGDFKRNEAKQNAYKNVWICGVYVAAILVPLYIIVVVIALFVKEDYATLTRWTETLVFSVFTGFFGYKIKPPASNKEES